MDKFLKIFLQKIRKITRYAGRGVTAHYGAAAIGNPRELELKACRMLGKRAAENVIRNFGQQGNDDIT